jgi:hypothetical protein
MNFYERLNNDYPDCMKLHSYTKQNINKFLFHGTRCKKIMRQLIRTVLARTILLLSS